MKACFIRVNGKQSGAFCEKKFVCFFLVIYVKDRVGISSLHVTKEFFVNNFCKYFFANCRSTSPAQDAVFVTLI